MDSRSLARRALGAMLLGAVVFVGLTSTACQSAAPPVPVATPAAPPPPPVETPVTIPNYTIEQFLGTTKYFGASFSPDGSKLLVSSDQTGVFNAFAIPVSGGEPVQLTRSDETVGVVGYFPKDERFLFTSDKGGNELTHIYVRELDGTIRDLTPGDKHKADFIAWSRDEKSFFWISNERDERFFDLYETTVDGYQKTLLYQNDTGLDVADISPDRRFLALAKTLGTSDSDVYLHDRKTGETKILTEHPSTEGVSNLAQAFSLDSAWLYATTDQGSEFSRLVRYEVATGKREEVLRTDWDIVGAAHSRGGQFFVVWVNNDAKTEIRVYQAASLPSLVPVALPSLPTADISTVLFSRDGQRMAFYADSSRAPRNLFVQDLPQGELRQLTRSLNAAIDVAHLVEAQVVRFRSFDGTVIPGLLYKPKNASSSDKVPALVWVHGGPGGQSRVGYSELIQYLVNHGYAVYAINNRGSSGYGKTFFRADDRKHGQDDLGDCIASKSMLEATGWVDPERIGIFGGSYGGYMVLAALTFQPQEFAVGVNLFGVANWLRTLESIPAWWESFRKALYQEIGDPTVDRDYLIKISPLFHAEKIERPLMVLQGANDPRVLKVESDEIVAAAKKGGTPVEYVVFPDEGHGFVKKVNQEKGYKAILDFLNRHLKKNG